MTAYRADKDIDGNVWSVKDMAVCLNCHSAATPCITPKEDAYGTERQEKKLSQQWQQGIQK